MIKDLLGLYKASLYKNAFFIMLNSIIVSVLGFVFWSLNARNFNSHDVGLALTLISSMSLISNISILGFDDAIIGYLGKSNKKDIQLRSIFMLCGIVTLFLAIIFIVFISLLSPSLLILKENVVYSILFILFTLFWTYFVLLDSVFIAFRDSKFVLIKNSLFSILKLILPLILISLGFIGIYSSWSIAAIISFLFILLILPRNLKFKPHMKLKFEDIKHMFQFSFSNFIMKTLMSTPGLLLPLIITSILSADKTAYFYIPWMILEFLAVIPNSISISLFAEGSQDANNLWGKLKKSIKIGYLFLIPITILLLIFSKFILGVFGKEYLENSLRLLFILAVTTITMPLNSSYITLKRIEKGMKSLVYIGIYYFIMFLGLCLVLIMQYGITGIGISWLITNLIFSFYVIYIYRKMKNEQ